MARRVLVVDDNRDATETMAMLLGIWGHDTRSAHDGPSALGIAQEFQPEVILLDIGLPGMDGFEVARRVHSLPGLRNTVLIAMTATVRRRIGPAPARRGSRGTW